MPLSRLEPLITSEGIEKLVSAYFTDERFAGSLFDTLGDNDPLDLTNDDLLAVSLLDVRFSPRAIRQLFDLRRQVVPLLQRIPTNLDMWEIGDENDAWVSGNELWRRIEALPDVGWVKTNKLLARKRPRVFPVYDSVTRRILNPDSEEFWKSLRDSLDDSTIALVKAWGQAIEPEPSVLRLIDVAAWMAGSGSENVRSVREKFGYPEP